MPAPRKYPLELRERSIRLVNEAMAEDPELSMNAAVLRIGPVAGTGTPTTDYGVGATDLCEFMEFPSRLLQVCGDSFAGQGVGRCDWAVVGFPRSV